jgi:cell division protein FtsW (lipid II flippase)
MAGARRRLALIVISLICVGAVFLSAIRISAFGLMVSFTVLVVVMAKSRVRAVSALLGMAMAALVFSWMAPAISINEEYASNVALDAFFGRASRGIVDPLSEGTLWERIDLWLDLFGRIIPQYPLGMGLSVPTLGAWRFDSAVKVGTESYAVAVFVATGFIGGGLLLAVFGGITARMMRLYRRAADPIVGIVVALTAGIIFTSLVGNSLSLYTVGPLGWGLMGWLSTREPKA